MHGHPWPIKPAKPLRRLPCLLRVTGHFLKMNKVKQRRKYVQPCLKETEKGHCKGRLAGSERAATEPCPRVALLWYLSPQVLLVFLRVGRTRKPETEKDQQPGMFKPLRVQHCDR